MILDLHQLQELILRYKYFIIFPLVAIEGPIVTIIAGFFTASGFLSLPVVLPVIVFADIAGDSFYYFVGRFLSKRTIIRFGKFFGLTAKKIESAEAYIRNNPYKSFTLGKLAHGPGIVVLLGAGMAKVSYAKFVTGNFFPTAGKSLILFLIGYYFGKALVKINSYLDYSALLIATALLVIYLVYLKFFQKKL